MAQTPLELLDGINKNAARDHIKNECYYHRTTFYLLGLALHQHYNFPTPIPFDPKKLEL